jgi:nitrile hydratase
MNGIHDCGGMEALGPIEREENEPIFHAEWERRVFGLLWAAGFHGHWNIDESRHAMERMEAKAYLAAPYFEHWLHGLETLLVEKGIVTASELGSRPPKPRPGAVPAAVMKPADVPRIVQGGFPLKVEGAGRPRFKPGDHVVTRNINPHGHTRLPRYARAKAGLVICDYGLYPFPDRNAHGDPAVQNCYLVRFTARELWGADASERDTLCLELWDEHLDPVPAS